MSGTKCCNAGHNPAKDRMRMQAKQLQLVSIVQDWQIRRGLIMQLCRNYRQVLAGSGDTDDCITPYV